MNRFLLLCLLLASHSLLAAPLDLRMPNETNILYGMDHGAALLMDVYRPGTPNGYALLFVMGTGFTAAGEYDDVPLKELDRNLLQFGVFSDYYGEHGQFFGPALDQGFTVFSINHRLGPKHVWTTQLRDCQRAVQFIKAHAADYQVSTHWIAAMGHSSGATMVSLLAVCDDAASANAIDPIAQQSSRIQAVVAAAGVHDPLAQRQQIAGSDASLMSMTGRSISYQPPGHPVYEDYRQASTLTHITPDDPPFFILHGTADDAVHFEQSKALAVALTSADIPNNLLLLEGANHAELGVSTDPLPLVQAANWLTQQLP